MSPYADRIWSAVSLAISAGTCAIGYVIGRWNGRKVLDDAERKSYREGRGDGQDQGWDAALMQHGLITDDDDPVRFGQIVTLDGSIPLRAGGATDDQGLSSSPLPRALAAPVDEPFWPDEPGPRIYSELAALAAEDLPRPGDLLLQTGPLEDTGPGQPARPSPYSGRLTAAQRRRDRHKHRGDYPLGPLAWSRDEADVMSPHWKELGEHYVTDWRIIEHDHIAAVDEYIADMYPAWQRFMESDRWDRGVRRLVSA